MYPADDLMVLTWPSKNVKVVSSPSLVFVFNHQPLLQHAWLIFLILASADGWQDMTKFGHLQTRHWFLPSKTLNCGRWCHCKGQLLSGIQLSTIRLSVKRARTGNNLKLSNMGASPWAFRWHLLSMMHMSCTLLMISWCSPDSAPQKMSKGSHLRPWSLSSIINRCFNMPGWFFWFSHLQMVDKIWQSLAICKLDTASYPQKPLNCGRWCHSKWQCLCGIQLSTIRLSAKTASTGNNLKLSNMGTSPWAFRWHLLSMMHMSCTLLMISCCSPDPQKMSKWSHLRPWSLSSIINRCFNMPGWFFWFSHLQMVDKIWQSLAICKLDTASYPQKPSTVADDVIATAALWDSVVHYQTISQKSSHW